MNEKYQKMLDEAFERRYPYLIEFADSHTYVSKVHKEKYAEFKVGFLAGLEAAGVSLKEVYGKEVQVG